MARRPFDPTRIRKPAAPAPDLFEHQTISVRALNERVRGAIRQYLPGTLHVVGEISDLARPRSGHLYFTLKDRESELRCVLWKSDVARLKFAAEAGMEVVATGALEVYTPRGTYQLIVRRLEPRGVGALEVALRQLREKLEREGLFDPARKRPLPQLPRRIGLVTSPRGAAIRDILQTLRERFAIADVVVAPARVQGEGAAAEIVTAIQLLNENRDALDGIDVLIVGRGGGSLEDLWAFNDETLVRAVATSSIPVVSAVGHEVDVSLCDLAADARAATPTAAAQLVTPHWSALDDELDRAGRTAHRGFQQRLSLAKTRLTAILASDPLTRPTRRVHEHMQRTDELVQRLASTVRHRYEVAAGALARSEADLDRQPHRSRVEQARRWLTDVLGALDRSLRDRLDSRRRALDDTIRRLATRGPQPQLARYDERLDQVTRNLLPAVQRSMERRSTELARLEEIVAVCDPRRVLDRGFSITRDARTRKIIRTHAKIRDGQRLVTELPDGEVRSTADDPRQPRLFE